jgi:hypothetical protein
MDRKTVLAGGATVAASLILADCQSMPFGLPNPVEQFQSLQEVRAWAGSLALQAVTYAAPLVAMYNLRSTVALSPKAKARPGDIWRFDDIASPEVAAQSGYVTPNVNVIYGFGFIDLAREPYILTAPDSRGRYYMIQLVDMWTNSFAYPVGEYAGYKGGTFALVGPGWTGKLPPNVIRIDCPTRWIEIQPRVHVKNAADLPGARQVLHGIKLQPLTQYNGGPAPKAAAYDYEVPNVNPNVASSQMQFTDPSQFWSIFAAAMNENPPPKSEIESVLPSFKYLGIELGKPWDKKSLRPLLLGEMNRAVSGFGATMRVSVPLIGRIAKGWAILPADTGKAGADYMSRALVAVAGLTANTIAEALYYAGVFDSGGGTLTGAKRYAITFTQPMTYAQVVPPGFWSLTMYDNVTKYTVPNAIDRYALGGDDTLQKNADGSFTIYVQRDDPGGEKTANWLPAPPGAFYLILRSYAPDPAVTKAIEHPETFEGPPPIVAV